ncbi:hypothetical protein NPX13_g6334 [Xylaria arbuscula]|uniref:Uncharacterized protein n=1 Tax=Xylaria arbuscula TaxID=114810 RepID=A0A9W8TK79_9PEZI|nr:hypothetical protein NPX13_g6334 [Xylaria arbuscula]
MHVWDRISHAVRHGKLVGVNKIICFGLKGSRSWHQADPLTEDQERKGHGNPDLVRHVAALWIAEAIASCTRERVRVYSEGSSYLDRDVDALTAHGITPLSGERGQHESFLKIDAHMLVFMFSGIASKAIQVVCATNRPACIIAQIMRLNGAEEGLRRAFDHLDAEYREHADWLPFYLFAFHSGVRGPQSMEEFRREGQRPLQGATVWFRRARFNP